MSRIGKKPIEIPNNIEIDIIGNHINIKGEKGQLDYDFNSRINVKKDQNFIIVERSGNDKINKSLHGLTRKLISNMIDGVTRGFEKKLEIIGVGYRVQLAGEKLVINVGYSHPVEVIPPQGIKFSVEKNTILVKGIDKQLVGEVAAKIRKIRKPEPYKGKGIRYIGELVKLKPGKAAKTATA